MRLKSSDFSQNVLSEQDVVKVIELNIRPAWIMLMGRSKEVFSTYGLVVGYGIHIDAVSCDGDWVYWKMWCGMAWLLWQCLFVGFNDSLMWRFLNRGNLQHEAFLRNAKNSEETLRKEAIERTDLGEKRESAILASIDVGEGEIYQVPATGAVVSMNSAVGLVHFYCSQLPSDRYLCHPSDSACCQF